MFNQFIGKNIGTAQRASLLHIGIVKAPAADGKVADTVGDKVASKRPVV